METRPDEEAIAFAHRMLDLARAGDAATLAGYLDAGVPANLTDHKGDTLLILAAYHDSPETVRVLLERGADPDRMNDRGQTALSAATFRNSEEAVRALLAAGADPGLGSQSAVATARFFDLPRMREILAERPSPT